MSSLSVVIIDENEIISKSGVLMSMDNKGGVDLEVLTRIDLNLFKMSV